MELDHPTPWRQLDLWFAASANTEQAARAFFAHLREAETAGVLAAWFFIRKTPVWRIRYAPTDPETEPQAYSTLHRALSAMADRGLVARWNANIYEPEVHAFGGPDAMESAHKLFHADSRNIAAYLEGPPGANVGRRELSLLLCTAIMRGAGQEWHERGDVWATVSDELRPSKRSPALTTDQAQALQSQVKHLITANTTASTTLRTGALEFAEDWLSAFEETGRHLGSLRSAGSLTRGIRLVLAHHIIFHWNRIGLSYSTQADLALAAKQTVFGCAAGLRTSEPRAMR